MGYRERIYGQYVKSRHEHLAPTAVAGFKPRAPYLRKLIRDHFPTDRSARIIELGCGHGALLYFAKQAGYKDVIGVDRSPQQVAAASNLGIVVKEGDLMDTLRDVAAESVDAVIAFDVIEHFTKHEVIVFVDEVARVLKSNGRFLIHTCNGESPFGASSFHGDLTHEICFTRVSIGQLLMSSGFKRVLCVEDTPVPHGPVSAFRWLLWKGIRAGLRLWTAAETGNIARQAIFTRNFLAVAYKDHQHTISSTTT